MDRFEALRSTPAPVALLRPGCGVRARSAPLELELLRLRLRRARRRDRRRPLELELVGVIEAPVLGLFGEAQVGAGRHGGGRARRAGGAEHREEAGRRLLADHHPKLVGGRARQRDVLEARHRDRRRRLGLRGPRARRAASAEGAARNLRRAALPQRERGARTSRSAGRATYRCRVEVELEARREAEEDGEEES